MSLLSLIAALLLEQLHPLAVGRWIHAPLRALADFLENRFNDGQARHGMVAWLIAILPPMLLIGLSYGLLRYFHPMFALVLDVAVLYLTMGFRQSSHFFTDIHRALRDDDLASARNLIAEWRGRGADRCSSSDVARLAIEKGLIAAHRNVFGVIFWFIVLGPAGAVLYRMADFFALHWGRRSEAEFGHFGEFAQQAFALMDWLPVRITAVVFAIVGDFEDALYCWRNQASSWFGESSGILLAAGAGALGVRLGMPVFESGEITERPELGLGEDADVDFMQSTVGLIWRALVLCLLLLLLFQLASLVG